MLWSYKPHGNSSSVYRYLFARLYVHTCAHFHLRLLLLRKVTVGLGRPKDKRVLMMLARRAHQAVNRSGSTGTGQQHLYMH